MKSLLFFLELILAKECLERSDPRGRNYQGVQETTGAGLRFPVRKCGPWKPKSGWRHNFCRNPNNSPLGPWCWVAKSELRPGLPPKLCLCQIVNSVVLTVDKFYLTTRKRDCAIFPSVMKSNLQQQQQPREQRIISGRLALQHSLQRS